MSKYELLLFSYNISFFLIQMVTDIDVENKKLDAYEISIEHLLKLMENV